MGSGIALRAIRNDSGGSAEFALLKPDGDPPTVTPAEGGGPALEEGVDPLPEIGAVGGRHEGLLLEVELRLEAARQRRLHEALRGGLRQGRPVRQAAGEVARGAVELRRRDDAVDEAEAQRGGRVEGVVQEDQVERAPRPEEPGERPGRAAVGARPEARIGGQEGRGLGRDAEVAGEREAEPPPATGPWTAATTIFGIVRIVRIAAWNRSIRREAVSAARSGSWWKTARSPPP